MKIQYFSQPNLLAGKELVPEFFQEAASAENLADALARWFEHPAQVARVQREFAAIHDAPALRWRRTRREPKSPRCSPRSAAGGAAMKACACACGWPVSTKRGVDRWQDPVVAAAVILIRRGPSAGLADSKVLEPEERERLALLIRERALCYSVAWADAEEIDSINILQATMLAMRRALLGLPCRRSRCSSMAIAVPARMVSDSSACSRR